MSSQNFETTRASPKAPVTLTIDDFERQFKSSWARVRLKIMGEEEQEYRFGRPHRDGRRVHLVINDPSLKELRGDQDRTEKFEKGPLFECSGLYSLKMPLVEAIGDFAVLGCADLMEVHAPKVQSVGKQAFFDCFNLIKVDLNSCEDLEAAAFCGCRKLKSIRISNEAKVKKNCFSLCTALANKTRVKNRQLLEENRKPFEKKGIFWSSNNVIDLLAFVKWERTKEESTKMIKRVMLALKLLNLEDKRGAPRALTENKVMLFLANLDDAMAVRILSFVRVNFPRGEGKKDGEGCGSPPPPALQPSSE